MNFIDLASFYIQLHKYRRVFLLWSGRKVRECWGQRPPLSASPLGNLEPLDSFWLRKSWLCSIFNTDLSANDQSPTQRIPRGCFRQSRIHRMPCTDTRYLYVYHGL